MKGEVALGDVKAGAAGFWWCLHIADSRIALGGGGFRFSGLETIENEEEKKSESW
jgi:hypothetical protein